MGVQGSKSKYHSVTINPTCATAEVADGKNIFILTKIPNACPRGGTSILKGLTVTRFDDHATDIEFIFFQNKSVGIGGLAATSTAVNMTDANARLAKPLGQVLVDVSSMQLLDLTNGRQYRYAADGSQRNTDFNLFCHSDPSDTDIANGDAEQGAIYVCGVATATETYSADGLEITFHFET
tara:strand:+ start:185 stop:727 length:543 start_codon:yes stop_codon:yes gene_type:complete